MKKFDDFGTFQNIEKFDDFKIFIGHQLLKNQNQANIIPTYLSKNNNNILRIKSILEYHLFEILGNDFQIYPQDLFL